MAFVLKTLLTIALFAAAHIYSANGAPPPTASDRLDAPLTAVERLLSLDEFGKFIAMFDQQIKRIQKAQAKMDATEYKDVKKVYENFQNTKAYKEFKQEKANISKKDLTNLLKEIDAMADRLVIEAKVAAAEFEVPYSLEVELNNGSKTTYFEEYFNKKLLKTKDSFAEQEGNESLQKCLTEVNSELFNKVYETLLSIAAYTSMISLHGSIIKEFFENYESTEVANDLMKKCKEKVDENKKANEKAHDESKEMLEAYGNCFCGSICGFLICAPACPLFCAVCTVTACAETRQKNKFNEAHQAKLIEFYEALKKHTWKKKAVYSRW